MLCQQRKIIRACGLRNCCGTVLWKIDLKHVSELGKEKGKEMKKQKVPEHIWCVYIYFGIKEDFIKKRTCIQIDWSTRDLLYKNKNKQEKNLSMKQNFSISQHIWEGNSSKITVYFTPNKGQMPNLISQNLSEDFSLKVRQTVAYTAHCHKELASFLFPEQAKLVNRNWYKVARHAQQSPKIPNKVFYKESAI